ncbi:hypothetical protein BX600DRAFT_261678 [Xylariales sp. PMI_506]|nr:hypothetical protein BX600DRAFT_261678 [Xylariales sp. PMI_506]
MLRRPHSKSRNGCSQCKRRRVRCDAVRPACSYCNRRQEICEYLDMIIQEPSSRKVISPRSIHSSRPIENRTVEAWLNLIRSLPSGTVEDADPTPLPALSPRMENDGYELNLRQLKLMHHWYDQAYLTMALDESQTRSTLWNRVVPMLATDHPFLMHGLLAVSAAHIAHNRTDLRDSYLPVARRHYGLGLQLFEDLGAPESPAEVQSLHEAKVVFVLMSTILSLAFTARTGCAERDIDICIELLVFLCASLELAHKFYKESLNYGGTSRISVLLHRPEDGPSELLSLDGDTEASLDLLNAKAQRNETASPADKEQICNTIAKIKLWIRLVSLRPQKAFFTVTGARNFSKDFLRLVGEKDPASLIVVAHFLVPLCHAPRKWYWHDWFEAVIAAIAHVLPSDEWRSHLGWVSEQVDVSRFCLN